LYNTLHYYEHRIRDRNSLKKKLVSSIIGKYLFFLGGGINGGHVKKFRPEKCPGKNGKSGD
jgi:hypothetical protein